MPPRECARCGEDRTLCCRGLCARCRARCRREGTITDYGYVKTDRFADYALMWQSGEILPVAAARLGVSERTARRYEAELRRDAAACPRSREAA